MPPDLLSKLLIVMRRQETHDSLIGSLELNLAKVTATGWQPPVSLDEGLRLALLAQDARGRENRRSTMLIAIAPASSAINVIVVEPARAVTMASPASTRLSANTSPITRETVKPWSVARW